MAVEVLAVVDRGRPRVGVARRELDVAQRNTPVERGHDERNPEHVWMDGTEPGPLADGADHRGAVRRSKRWPSRRRRIRPSFRSATARSAVAYAAFLLRSVPLLLLTAQVNLAVCAYSLLPNTPLDGAPLAAKSPWLTAALGIVVTAAGAAFVVAAT